MIQNKSNVLWYAAVVLLSIVIISSNGVTEQGRRPVDVSLATGKNIWCSLVLIAKERGFFEQEGLNVTLNYQDAGRYCMDALLSKSVDFAAVVEANFAYVGFTGNKNPVALAQIVASSCGIVARKSKGIESAADLKGKRIAYTPATGAEPFLYRFLEKYKITTQDVKLIKMQPKALQPALAAGEIDAVVTWEPFINSSVKSLGGDSIELREPDVFTGYMMLASRKDWLSKNKAIAIAMMRALGNAEKFISDHPVETKESLSKIINMDIQDIEKVWPYFNFTLKMDKSSILQAIRYVGENARVTDTNFAKKPLPDYNGYIDTSYLPVSERK
ncbi:MAG: NrtA/SsuA/CpmA family ABC transporter substrate-binding protein [Nitrospirota bacterium]